MFQLSTACKKFDEQHGTNASKAAVVIVRRNPGPAGEGEEPEAEIHDKNCMRKFQKVSTQMNENYNFKQTYDNIFQLL